jgi:DNA-binding NtrC family response regulator
MTAYGSAESAVAAMKAGAADYLIKPFAIEELRLRVRRLAAQRAAEVRNARLVERLTPGLVAESAKMQEVVAAAKRVAATDATVLLLGESGTGKTQLARLIHYTSARAAAQLVEVHCAALPETLLESELFGHEKGAFTGASERKAGLLAGADRGTLFLDEIGEITQATQVKLLRFLQERDFVPVGSTQARKVDARVIAATNRDLATAVSDGDFREDFYYRLNVFAIVVPPLRERVEDIVPLAERFLTRRGIPPVRLTGPARDRLCAHAWPGNVRELENALERALILAGDGELLPAHLAPQQRAASGGAGEVLTEGFNLDAFEKQLLDAAIERAGGNKAAAARLLGITRRRLYSMLQTFNRSEVEEP